MVKIISGPILGALTHEIARIVVEVDGDVTLSCVCRETINTNFQVTVPSLKFEANKPLGFNIKNLKPQTEYIVTFYIDDDDDDEDDEEAQTSKKTAVKLENAGERTAKFTTHSQHFAYSWSAEQATTQYTGGYWHLRCAGVSMNNSTRTQNDLYQAIVDRVLGNSMKKLDLLFHVGGQITGADEAFKKALEVVGSHEIDAKLEHTVAELYRNLYRKSFNDAAVRKLVSSVSNIMVMDDTNIRSNWGAEENDSNPASKEFKIGAIARKVFWEYGRQLWEEIDECKEEHDMQFFNLDNIGIVAIDQHAARTFHKDGEKPYLTKAQWSALEEALNERFSRVNALIVLSSSPVVFIGSPSSDLATQMKQHHDLKNNWACGQYREEQIEFIERLGKWVNENSTRSAVIVSGSQGAGAFTAVIKDGQRVLEQIICSPISPMHPKWVSQETLSKAEGKKEDIGQGYTIENHNFTTDCNFGIIDLQLESYKKKAEISKYIIKGSASSKPSVQVSSKEAKEKKCVIC